MGWPCFFEGVVNSFSAMLTAATMHINALPVLVGSPDVRRFGWAEWRAGVARFPVAALKQDDPHG